MNCPVCGGDCIEDAPALFARLPHAFAPCPDCMGLTYDKRAPPPDLAPAEPCPSCEKRFIDDVFAQIWTIMADTGDLSRDDPLAAAGTPLVHPGIALHRPPYLPPRSLVLLSRSVTEESARRLVAEVPEVRGVVRNGDGVPGVIDTGTDGNGRRHTLLAGCDVRADIFDTPAGPIAVYKQQSVIHIEFPHGQNPKILATYQAIRKRSPRTFVDTCSGAGTLGLAGGVLGVPAVICNDAWYAAAFWTACNIGVNREALGVEGVQILHSIADLAERPVATEPVLVAVAEGARDIRVYHGDLRLLPPLLPDTVDLTAIDLFEKDDREKLKEITRFWIAAVGGDVFIP